MAEYDDHETSISNSAPYELYEWIGTYRNYYMTSDVIAHEFNSRQYMPVAGLERSALSVGTHADDGIDITVQIPIGEQIVKDYAFQTTPPSLELTIYRFQRDTEEYAAYWKGKVASISTSDEFATFRSPSKFGSMLSGNIPSVFIQPPCNNVLFDELCKVGRVANSLDTSVASVSGNVVTIPSLGGFASDWFVGGEIAVSARNERRMIVAQDGVNLTVNYAFSNLSEGTAIQVTAGCDHSFTSPNGCPKFNNQKTLAAVHMCQANQITFSKVE